MRFEGIDYEHDEPATLKIKLKDNIGEEQIVGLLKLIASEGSCSNIKCFSDRCIFNDDYLEYYEIRDGVEVRVGNFNCVNKNNMTFVNNLLNLIVEGEPEFKF